MLYCIVSLAILCGLFWIGFHITGALLSAMVWLCVKLPLTIVLWTFGLCCICTLILLPLGFGTIRRATRFLLF